MNDVSITFILINIRPPVFRTSINDGSMRSVDAIAVRTCIAFIIQLKHTFVHM